MSRHRPRVAAFARVPRTDTDMDPIVTPLVLLAFVLLVPLAIVWRKGRPFAPGDVFRASRLSAGNRIFPTQVLITPTNVVHFRPQWVGRLEHSIHMAHVASVSIDTNLVFSDVYIETTGGARPIHCRGHHKGDALRMKALIERYQTAYYRKAPGHDEGVGPADEPARG